MTRKEALKITGGLSKPGKMPCPSINLPAKRCITGSKLRHVKNSICSACYACKNRYTFNEVQTALERRYQQLQHPRWVEALVYLLKHSHQGDARYFRFHDSGDLQGLWHLKNIIEVCQAVPERKFWLATRENAIVEAFIKLHGPIPKNLCIRLSAVLWDNPGPVALAKRLGLNTSGASREHYTCPAHEQGNQCRDCRRCWNRRVQTVMYRKH